jgi:hypothetical protein
MGFTDQTDFNRASRGIADGGIKMFFGLFNSFLSFMINFIKEMVGSILGK